MAEIEDLRHEAALEMSLQRHSYEDEIASLTRVLEERQEAADGTSLPEPLSPSTNADILDEIELVLQETQRRAALSAKNSNVIFLFLRG